jgi:hypothetical protein
MNLRAALIKVPFHMRFNLSDSHIQASHIVQSTVWKMYNTIKNKLVTYLYSTPCYPFHSLSLSLTQAHPHARVCGCAHTQKYIK